MLQIFIKRLRTYARALTPQQIRTLKGQAIAGDIAGAQKGLARILMRGNKH
jgi:hypothetical protein